MTGALILLAITVLTGLLLWLTHDGTLKSKAPGESHGPGCCGQHAVCEKYPPRPDEKPEYYDDEELDRFIGCEEYTPEDEEEFRDILYTLLPQDRLGWGISLEKRGIMMPDAVKEEFRALLNEPKL